MTEISRELQPFDFRIGLVELAQEAPGFVYASVVDKKQEAFRRYLSLFAQIAQYCREPADGLAYHQFFVEARNNDCETRPSSREIGRDGFVVVGVVPGQGQSRRSCQSGIIASPRFDPYSVSEIATDGITGV